jgi:drug/metabolite transporter (DMT)-like permease
VIVVFGLLALKRAQANGASTWTTMICVTWMCALIFPLLAFLGGEMQPVGLLWQPAIIGVLFMAGQGWTFLAVKLGDVSIAAPVQGIKVLIVPAIAMIIVRENMPGQVWFAAAIAMVGVVCVQTSDDKVDRSRILASVGFAALAALTMSVFDLLIQRWAPAWGAGYFLPLALGFAALFSVAFLPLADAPKRWFQSDLRGPLILGSVLMAVQAIGMTVTLAHWGDATRVNIVYSLRGLWGVLITWALLHQAPATSGRTSSRTMSMRLVGAILIGVAVVIAVTARR